MKRLALLYHPHKEIARELAEAWRAEIMARGAPEPIVENAWDEARVDQLCHQADLLLTLGGDGTLLRAARSGALCGVPVMGVKLGTVGFLSGLHPDAFSKQLERLLNGEYWIEERMMVRARWRRDDQELGVYDAINDVVVSRGKLARVIRIEAAIDGEVLQLFSADGAIIATATGSTAYSLAAGGPILAPTVRTMLITLISPYLSPITSLVLPEGAHVSLQVHSQNNPILTIDGQTDYELQDGDVVETKASPNLARFARLEARGYFYRTLVNRLRESDDGL
ncbi:MAG: NAD(+)/NADH kinase [Chloroflexota bacterium]|nr:MAG: NAD(+)/NADH kinase [Chloroflexota bacterium]